LSLHGAQFSLYLANDYKWWHSILLKWLSKTEEEKKVTFRAINTFYMVVAEEIAERNDHQAFSVSDGGETWRNEGISFR